MEASHVSATLPTATLPGATPSHRLRILLTVPHLQTASPYREMMAIAASLPRDEFHLTICSLRNSGFAETALRLSDLDVPLLVAAFRPRARSLRGVLKSLREQALISRMGPFDIQHSLDFTSSPFEAAVARWHGRRFVFSQRNMNEGGHASALRVKIQLATHVVAISAGTRRLLERHGAPPTRVTTIYNGIDLDTARLRSRETRQSGKEVVLCVGQIVPRKRQADAIRAFARLASEKPAAVLRIVGPIIDTEYHERLLALSKELQVSDRIEFVGERSDVPDLMSDADALILCSEQEAFGWVILEAMASGLPVVASNSEGPSEIIDHPDTGFLIPIGDIEGYAQALRRILGDRVLAARLATKACAMVEERFRVSTMVTQLASLYRTLCGSP